MSHLFNHQRRVRELEPAAASDCDLSWVDELAQYLAKAQSSEDQQTTAARDSLIELLGLYWT